MNYPSIALSYVDYLSIMRTRPSYEAINQNGYETENLKIED